MKILFICEGNMMRSQMAEVFYNKDKGMDFVREVRDEIRQRVEKLIRETR